MNWAQSFFYSVCVLAIAVVVASLSPVIAQNARSGGYMVASDGDAFVWRVNTSNGTVSYCARRSDSLDPVSIQRERPTCSGFSELPAI